MRWITLAVLWSLLVLCSRASADEEPPQTAEQVADATIVAWKAGDRETLRALAEGSEPDPWMVSEFLLLRAGPESALAFAAAARTSRDTEGLKAYVEARAKSGLPDLQATLRAVRTSPTAAAAVQAAAEVQPGADVLALHILSLRAMAQTQMGQHEQAQAAFQALAQHAADLGWLRMAADALAGATRAAERRSDFKSLLRLGEKRLALARARGDRRGEAATHTSLSSAFLRRGAFETAVEHGNQAVALYEATEDDVGLADACNVLGIVYFNYERLDEALEAWTRARSLAMARKDRALVAGLTVNIGNIHSRRGNVEEAIASYEEGVRLAGAAGHVRFQGIALDNLAGKYESLGMYTTALEIFERALALKRAESTPRGLGSTLANQGVVLAALGRFEEAIRSQEEAVRIAMKTGDRVQEATAQKQLGITHMRRGDNARALQAFEAAVAASKGIRHGPLLVESLYWLGWVYDHVQAREQALEAQAEGEAIARQIQRPALIARHLHLAAKIYIDVDAERSLAAAEEAAGLSPPGDSTSRTALALAYSRLGRHAEAHAIHEALLTSQDEGRPTVQLAKTLVNLGNSLRELGRAEEAIAAYDRALSIADAIGATRVAGKALSERARVAFETDQQADIVRFARESVARQALQVHGLSEELGASARERSAIFHEDGVRAAVATKDAASAFFLLESVRAMALLESLGGRATLRAAALPDDLLVEEQTAVANVREATARLQVARQRGRLKDARAARKQLETEEAKLLATVDRLQRASKAGVDLVYPSAASVEEVSSILRPREAYVGYAWTHGVITALITTTAGMRSVQVKVPDDLGQHLDGLVELESPTTDAVAREMHLTALRATLVAPLKLEPELETILIAPAGRLAYVPFSLLLPERTVAYMPSGTLLRTLRGANSARGQGVLALGDPAYRAGTLPPLPGSRGEVEAIGDVILMGAKATEGELQKALPARARWRAVHFACHGLVRPERPLLSSLALTPTEQGDGLLTVHELLNLHIPADLVVLSACETARGKLYQAEGVMGFVRALMLAGAPRAIVSLWKVDDAATRALMIKFYEFWKGGSQEAQAGGLGTAEALRRAQAYIRSQPAWNHPYFWAAWVLWGLPE